ncbi:MAG: hypothetical protein ACRDHZ_16080 [Ktedonobacteraceae bacterium]
MDENNHPDKRPMSQEQIDAEAAFAEKIYKELSSENLEKAREIIRRRRRSKAASIADRKSGHVSSQ